MILGELKSAIRRTRGNVFVRAPLAAGMPTLTLLLQKSALFDELDRAYPQGKKQETGLTFNPENGEILAEGGPPVAHVAVPIPSDDDLLTDSPAPSRHSPDPDDDLLV